MAQSLTIGDNVTVAIPLGQGQVFNKRIRSENGEMLVAIPLGQGQVFNPKATHQMQTYSSQSLWVRDRFLICFCIER